MLISGNKYGEYGGDWLQVDSQGNVSSEWNHNDVLLRKRA